MTDSYFIIELTTRCNLDCIYCYNVWKGHEDCSQKQLSLSEIRELFDRLCEQLPIKGVTLAGGEPLMHQELPEITKLLRNKGLHLSITTNGTLLNENKIAELVACGISHFEISWPSLIPDMYDRLCRSGEIIKIKQAILGVKKHGVKLTVSSVITKLNFLEIPEIIELSAALGADFFVLNRFIPGGTGLKNHGMLAPDDEQLLQTFSLADDAARTYRIPVIAAIPVEHCLLDTGKFNRIHFGTCACGSAKWVIDPWGNLRTCEQNPECIGNIFEKNFDELIQHASVTLFREDDLHSYCKDKKCYEFCGGGCRFNKRVHDLI
jgi:AdoMet-dependent heme synthase